MSCPAPADLQRRDGRLSLLKLLAAFAVVVVHTAMLRVAQGDTQHLGWWLANIADAAGHIGSATFALVAGAVLLGRPAEQAPGAFVLGRMRRLLPAVLVWSAVYFAWRAWGEGQPLSGQRMLRDVVLGMPMYHLWFLFMMLAMYCVLPALRHAVLGLQQHPRNWPHVLWVLALLTWVVNALQAWQQVGHSSFVALVPLFVIYFLAGYYLLRYPLGWSSRQLVLLGGVCVVVMALGTGWLYPRWQDWALMLFYSNRSPWAMGLALCVFVLMLRHAPQQVPPWVHGLGAVTLGVYAMHPLVMALLARGGWLLPLGGGGWLLQAVQMYVASLLLARLLYALPGVRRVVS